MLQLNKMPVTRSFESAWPKLIIACDISGTACTDRQETSQPGHILHLLPLQAWTQKIAWIYVHIQIQSSTPLNTVRSLTNVFTHLSGGKDILQCKQAAMPHFPLGPSEELHDPPCNVMNRVRMQMNSCYTQHLSTGFTHWCNHLHTPIFTKNTDTNHRMQQDNHFMLQQNFNEYW